MSTSSKTKTKKDDRLLTIEELMAQSRKDFGDDVVFTGRGAPPIPRIPTGSLSYDVSLGGGLPAGQWTEVVGEESSGKTSWVYKLVEANQIINPDHTTLWIESEPFVDPWAEAAGCDLDRIIRIRTQRMERAYDTVIAYMANRAIDLVVIDSLPALTPEGEYDGEMGDSLPGLAARLNNKFFRKAGLAMARPLVPGERLTTGIVVNQWRDKIGTAPQADPRTTPGGKGKNYAYFVRLELRRHEWIKVGGATSRRVGLSIGGRIFKNKSAPPQRASIVDFYFDNHGPFRAGQYDTAKDTMLAAMELDIIELRGSNYYFGDQMWKGRDPVLASLREDIGLRQQVYAETLSAVGPVTVPPAAVGKTLKLKR